MLMIFKTGFHKSYLIKRLYELDTPGVQSRRIISFPLGFNIYHFEIHVYLLAKNRNFSTALIYKKKHLSQSATCSTDNSFLFLHF